MHLYGLKTCDSCRAALKALRATGRQVGFTDLRAEGISAEDLARFHAAFGAALINRRSTTWRGLSESERASDPLHLLAAHPTLMKRPVIEVDGTLYLGWGPDQRAALLGNGAQTA